MEVPSYFWLGGGLAARRDRGDEIPCSGFAQHGLLRAPASCASGTLFSFFPSGAQHRPRGQETIQTRKGRANARTIRRCNVDSVRPNTSNAASSPRSRKDLLRASGALDADVSYGRVLLCKFSVIPPTLGSKNRLDSAGTRARELPDAVDHTF